MLGLKPKTVNSICPFTTWAKPEFSSKKKKKLVQLDKLNQKWFIKHKCISEGDWWTIQSDEKTSKIIVGL